MTFVSQRRLRGPKVVGLVLTIIGTAFLVVALLMGGFTLIAQSGTVATQGNITSCFYRRGVCQPTVSFQTSSGQQITIHSSTGSSFFAPGGSVPVRYHPDHPQDADVDPGMVFGLLSSIFGGVGLLFVVVGVPLFRFTKNRSFQGAEKSG